MKELITKRKLLTLLIITFIASSILSGCKSRGFLIHPGSSDSDAHQWSRWRMHKTIYVMNETPCQVAVSNLNGSRYGVVAARSGATLKVPLNPYMDENDEFKIQVKAVGKNPPSCADGIQFEGFDNDSDPEDLDVDLN